MNSLRLSDRKKLTLFTFAHCTHSIWCAVHDGYCCCFSCLECVSLREQHRIESTNVCVSVHTSVGECVRVCGVRLYLCVPLQHIRDILYFPRPVLVFDPNVYFAWNQKFMCAISVTLLVGLLVFALLLLCLDYTLFQHAHSQRPSFMWASMVHTHTYKFRTEKNIWYHTFIHAHTHNGRWTTNQPASQPIIQPASQQTNKQNQYVQRTLIQQ